MKKLVLMFMCSMFMLGIASWAQAAELRFGGDAYVEGIWQDNYDLDGTNNADDDYRWWDQQVRLKFDAVLENGIEVRTRLTVSDAKWNGATETRLGDTAYSKPTGPEGSDGVTPDYAYLHVPIGRFTVDAGHMLDFWGNALISWDFETDRVVLAYKPNEAMTYALYIQKDGELIQADNEGDLDTYALSFEHQLSEGNIYGITASYTQDQPDSGADHPLQDGWIADMYWNVQSGRFSVLSEAAVKSGAMFATPESGDGWNNQYGGFITHSVDISPLMLSLTGAVAANYFEADDDFMPTELFGDQGYIPLMNFKSLDEDRTSWLVALGADMAVSDALTVGGKLAYTYMGMTDLEDPRSSDDAPGEGLDGDDNHFSIAEIDASLSYEISKGVTYNIHAVYGIPTSVPEGWTKYDDNLFGMAHSLEIEF